ncbi:RnfH family protein [Sphaerotilus hippei]|nr:RnfH family protein [Sphaerotilus hippei]
MHVQVAFSPRPREVELASLTLPAGADGWQALAASGLLERHAGLQAALQSGAWLAGCRGRRLSLGEALEDGARLEIYRPLQVDPKEARRVRYRAQGGRQRLHRRPLETG